MSARKRLVEMPMAETPDTEPAPLFVVPEQKKKGMRAAMAEARRVIANALPDVAQALATHSKEGSVAHLRLFMEVSGLLKGGLQIKTKVQREKTVEELLDEEWARQKVLLGED